jgi:ATP-dependent HslUV protease, peptidase subunit HslV
MEGVVSIVVVVKKHSRVAIAADSLASFGTRKLSIRNNKRASKIFRIGTSWVGLTGWSVHQQVLEHLFRSIETPPKFASADEIFDAFLKLHPRLKQEYFMNPGDRESDAYESSQMTLLIANEHGIFGLYTEREVIEYERFWASGSGSAYALGAMNAAYDLHGDAVSIAEAGVHAGIEFDDGCGAPVESHAVPLITAHANELDLLLQA